MNWAFCTVERDFFSVMMRFLLTPFFLSQDDIRPDSVTPFFRDAVPPPIPGYSDLAMNAERSDVLRELCVATALYRLGDPDGVAKRSLDAYLTDPRRVYANFVRQVLNPKP